MWKAFRDVLRGTSFYYKQLNFFILLIGVGGALYVAPKLFTSPQHQPTASTELPRTLAPDPKAEKSLYTIRIGGMGDVTVNNTPLRNALTFEANKDRFLLVLVRDSPNYLSNIEAQVILPKPVTPGASLQPRIYAIHGVGASSYKVIDDQTIQFTAREIYQGAIVSIELVFPEGYFSLSSLGQLKELASSFTPSTWLAIGITFPIFTVLFLLYLLTMRFLSYMRIQNKEILPTPPQLVPPALVGTLYRGRIGQKEIMATIFDLANRGFVSIFSRGDGDVVFSKGANLFGQQANMLRPFEIFLLHQLFGEEEFLTKQSQVEIGLNSETFSSRIALTMLNIYDAALAEGYFIQSPNKYYLKYKITGVVLFFIAVTALLYQSFRLASGGYELFAWVGMIIAALIIVWVTPGLPHRTRRGEKVLKQWLGFRNYLRASDPIKSQETTLFFSYLPYALILDCEDAWIARWQQQILVLPEWFSSGHPLYTAKDYESSLVSVINFLANHLVAARPPDLA